MNQQNNYAVMFGVDVARIVRYGGRQFLIIGERKNTADGEERGTWFKNGKPWHFDYIQERVIASGNSDEELLDSAREYLRLCGLTMEEYLKEVTGKYKGRNKKEGAACSST